MTATAFAPTRLAPRKVQSADPDFTLAPKGAVAEPNRVDLAAEVIKEFEGLELEAYYCPANVLTIGYGHTRDVYKGQRITVEEADYLLREDMQTACRAVDELESQCPDKFTPHQAAALISFAYNIGSGGLLKSKSVAGRLRNGDYAAAADGLLKYVYAGGKRLRGLERRRERERHVFLTDPPRRPRVGIEAIDEELPASVTPSAPAEKPISSSTTVIAATTGAVTTATAAVDSAAGLSGDAQKYVLIGLGAVIFGTLIYIALERWRKNRRGEEF